MSCNVINLISISNKTGSSFIAYFLSTSLALANKNVLLIDFNLSSDLSEFAEIQRTELSSLSLLNAKLNANKNIDFVKISNFYYAYPTIDLSFNHNFDNSELIISTLKENLEILSKKYQFILIDTGKLTTKLSKLICSVVNNSYLIFNLKKNFENEIQTLLKSFFKIKNDLNPTLEITKVISNNSSNEYFNDSIFIQYNNVFENKLSKTKINFDNALNIFYNQKRFPAKKVKFKTNSDFQNLVNEILKKSKKYE